MVEMVDFTRKFSITLNFPLQLLYTAHHSLEYNLYYCLYFVLPHYLLCLFFLSWAKTEMTLNYSNFLTQLYTNPLFSGVVVLALVAGARGTGVTQLYGC